jgi:hypothetical protein
MINPVLIIGNNRSGTKWLSNMLLNHPEIAGVQHVAHDGIIETEIFSTLPFVFGPLDMLENRIGFIECFAATDYFRCTGLPKEDLYHFQARTYPAFYRELMDRLARSRGASHWLQKFPPNVLPGIADHFSDARFLIIVRDLVPTIRSHLRKWGKTRRLRNALRFLFWYYHGIKELAALRKRVPVIAIRYEDLMADREGTIQTICRSLGLTFDLRVLHDRFKPNTSFASSESADHFLTRGQEFWIRVWSCLFRLIPRWAYRTIYRYRHIFKSRPQPFYSLSFQILENEKGLIGSSEERLSPQSGGES